MSSEIILPEITQDTVYKLASDTQISNFLLCSNGDEEMIRKKFSLIMEQAKRFGVEKEVYKAYEDALEKEKGNWNVVLTKRGGIVFNGFSALKADDILNVKKGTRDKPSVTKDEVVDELLELLGEKGYAKLEDIQEMQKGIGCSPKTLYRARKDLELDTISMGYSKNKVTYWLAPDVDKEKFREEHKLQKAKGHNSHAY